MRKIRVPSPALAVALIALFVSLSGTAVAAGVVPLAKKALFANNAGKLQGKTAAQVVADAAAQPGPASSVASLVTVKSVSVSLNPTEGRDVAIACDAGQKAVGGGFSTSGVVVAFDSAPTADGAGWQLFLANLSSSSAAAGNAHAVCLR